MINQKIRIFLQTILKKELHIFTILLYLIDILTFSYIYHKYHYIYLQKQSINISLLLTIHLTCIIIFYTL